MAEKKMKNRLKNEEIEAAVIAISIAILMAGVKHAVASMLQQWRALVFLLLNLLLLAILFTSIKHQPRNKEVETVDNDKKIEKKAAKRKKSKCEWFDPVEEMALPSEESVCSDDECVENGGCDQPCLSKEELNAKVEAFIVMFRQQLASDAQRRRSRPSSLST
ncbi:hypothetical protein Scep_017658 [Stephania cephalantha]|uniref:Uncharacterized protein n=1 Tax=Stephania cephalantha TaxID=152367 RepID=A0AAP0IQV3_9MAGN